MPEVLDRLRTMIGDVNMPDTFGTKPEFEEEIFDRMWEFIVSLDPQQLSEEQADQIMSIIEDVELEYEGLEEDEVDEVAAKRTRIKPSERRKRKQEYRKNKAKIKRAAKKYKRSSRGKQMAKKSKRMKKQGKTATGRRIRKIVN